MATVEQFGDLFDAVSAGATDDVTVDLWARLRPLVNAQPILQGRGGLFIEIPELPNMWFAGEDTPTFMVFGFDTVGEVLRDAETFSSAGNPGYNLLFGPAIVSTDGEEHARYRTLAMPAFKRSTMDGWLANQIQPTVARAIDGLRRRQRADLIRDYAFPVPFRSAAGVIGMGEDDQFEVTRLVNTILNMAADPAASFEASQGLRDFMATIVEDRQANPGDDLASQLVASEVDGQRLEFEEVVSFLRLLGPAAMDTTYRSLGNLLFALLHNPDQLALLRTEPDRLPAAVEEGLRWESVGPFVQRTAVAGSTIEGVEIPSGSVVLNCLTMANRDPHRWDDPDRFDITRPVKPHHTFGSGPHTCLGFHLAKHVIQESVLRLLEAFEHIELDPDAPAPAITGLLLRSPASLPVLLR